ncbi:helix-turn-helix domain-containing protein [Lactobacillus terrae]|uniref:helix-turn-helix domain-containing protein n=1 Tax=Lactobacillus terrae TaxID=2269374 RepID=UPI000C1B7596|nr:helix-turn-helix domain-containing protein [Lactobacillus terrae]
MNSFTDIFLSKSEIEKVQLFTKIKQIKINQLASANLIDTYRTRKIEVSDINLRKSAYEMNKSYGSVYNTFLGIQEDFKEIYKKDDVEINDIFQYSSDEYHAYLTTKSDAYLLIEGIVKQRETSFTEFYTKLDSSKATVLRHLKEVREFLKGFGVRIAYEPLRFVGDEESITLAIASLYWNATRGYFWPFDDLREETALKVVELGLEQYRLAAPNEITKKFYSYLIMAHVYRMLDGHISMGQKNLETINYPFPNVFDSIDELLDIKPQSDNVKKVVDIIRNKMTLEEQMSQSAEFYILVICVPSMFDVSDSYIQSVTSQMQKYNPTFFNFTQEFLKLVPYDNEEIITKFGLTENSFARYQYNLMSSVAGVMVLGTNYLQCLKLFAGSGDTISKLRDDDLRNNILATVQHLVRKEEYASLRYSYTEIADALYSMAFRFSAMYSPVLKVRVYLELESFFLVYSDLSITLDSLPYVKIVNEPDQADVVITSNANQLPDGFRDDVCIFRWRPDGAQSQMGALLNLIYKIWTDEKATDNPSLFELQD